MPSKLLIFFIAIFSLISCKKNSNIDMDLTMTHAELVNAMIDLSTINGANQLNDPASKDSLSKLYTNKIEKLNGRSLKEIRRNLDILTKYPDTLLMLQNRALDTLRALQERQINVVIPADK